jgi:Ca2+-binding EF-hand superfamily protein
MSLMEPLTSLIDRLVGDNELTPIMQPIAWMSLLLWLACFLGGCCWGGSRLCGALCGNGYINLDRERADRLKDAARAAEAEVDRREAELARLRANLDAADQAALSAAEAEMAKAARAAAQARYEHAEKVLAFTRKEAAKRASEYRAVVQEMLRLPDLSDPEAGKIQTHIPIKATMPVFPKASEGTRNPITGVFSPGRVVLPKSPPTSARASKGPDGSGLDELGWGGNLYLLPQVYSDGEVGPQELGKMTLAARFSSWIHPSSPDKAPASALVAGAGGKPARQSYGQLAPFAPLHKKSQPSPPNGENGETGENSRRGTSFFSARSYGGLRPKSPKRPPRPPSPKGPSVPRKVFAALTPKASSFRSSPDHKRAGNILGTLKLNAHDALDTLPEQIRMALHKRHVRVIDLFRQLDSDQSGRIDLVEFVQSMREIGLQAPTDSISAVFHSFDPDHSGTIEYAELHHLLVRSVQKHPRLEPLKQKAETSVPLRKQEVSKTDANVFGNVGKQAMAELAADAPLDETVPNLIRSVLAARLVRVIDLFRQLDDDANGKVSVFEFLKAMREFGIDSPPNAIVAVFNSFDKDGDGYIVYKELDKLLRASKEKHPKLSELKSHPLKKPSGPPQKGGAGAAKGAASPPKSPKGSPKSSPKRGGKK